MCTSLMSLELNPSAKISISDRDTTPTFLVEAPIKGASFSSVWVCQENLPAAHAFLRAVLIDGLKTAQIGEQDALELRQIGILAAADELPQAIEYQFPLRDFAAPGRLLSRVEVALSAGKFAPSTTLNLPTEWSEQELRFAAHHHGSVWAPCRAAITEASNDSSECEPSEPTFQKIALDDEATRRQFEREGFAILQNLLPNEHVKQLAEYFQALAAQGFLYRHANRGTRRYTAHNHSVARFWHEQLNERVSQLCGRQTKPSYSFVSMYVEGGDLFWHTDRPPCEYTISLLIDYAPLAAHDQSPWPLKLKGRDGTTHSLHQRIGEASILKGRELSHGREVLPDGHRSASLLFHFVNEDYDGEMM